MKKKKIYIFLMVNILFLVSQAFSHCLKPSQVVVELITPKENSEVIAKKPLINCIIKPQFQPDALFVTLDGVDITQLLDITPKGFVYHPIQVLPTGIHNLSVRGKTQDGREFEKQFRFSSRHYKAFEEGYVNNDLDATYEFVIKKPSDVYMPTSKIESNLQTQSLLKSQSWRFSFNSNLKELDQNTPLEPPLKKGIDLVNYLLSGTYQEDEFNLAVEMGDVQVNETPNTVQSLGRRGGKLALKYGSLGFKSFVVKSDETFGF